MSEVGSLPETVDDGEHHVAAPAENNEMETAAYRMGWRPKAEYRGPPGEWRSAEEFLKRGQDILPIVRKDLIKARERANNMEAEILALRATVDEQKLVLEDLRKMARTASDAGYQRAIEELKDRRRRAAAAGDAVLAVEISEQIDQVREERAATVPATPAPKPSAPSSEAPKPDPRAKLDPAVVQFIEENPWFNTDPVLHRVMEAEHMALLQEAPGLTLEENLTRAKEAVVARYPRKFGIAPEAPKPSVATPAPEPEEEEETPSVPQTPARRTSVSAPSAPAASRPGKVTGIASIQDTNERASAQQAFQRAKRQMPDLTEDEWFKIYQDPRLDIVDVRVAAKKKASK